MESESTDKRVVVLLDEKSGRSMVLGPDAGWFKPGADAPWELITNGEGSALPEPDDIAENFAAVTGKEADSLVMSASASAKSA